MRHRLFMIIYAYILRRCDSVIFGSKAQQRLWIEKYGIRQDKSTVIYNGVDNDYFGSPEAGADEKPDRPRFEDFDVVIGCVAHLRPEKSHKDLLAAMKKITEKSEQKVLLLLVGHGPEEPGLRYYAESNGLSDSVKFCGRTDDVRPFLEAMDIFVMPSSTEVFSNAILEAMTCGLPVVCTAVGGSVEMVVDGVTGFTYPRHDVDSLAESLSALIQDKAKREQFGQRGAARVKDSFSIERMDDQYTHLISGQFQATTAD
ncbi:MAG: glycosyltransferase [Burkholderiales bacterium]|nr:glycosyltransferase [Burkholderiales bacterium]